MTFTGVGFLLGTSSTLQILWEAQHALSDAQTLDPALMQDDDEIREIDEHIRQHPLAVALRNDPTLTESRPHLKIPATMLKHHLTGGLLMGPGRVTVPPLVFTEAGGKSLVAISHLGADLCGHPGIVHGGLLATLIDEGLARCCFGALPNHIAMTANLKIDYRAPVKAGTYVVLRAKTVKVEGRKAWVTGHVETLVDEGQTPVLLAEATGLFIEPRNAAVGAHSRR